MTDVLSFDAIEPERAFVRIGDNRYQLALPDDLGLVALARIERVQRLMESFDPDKVEDDPAEADKLHRALREAVRIVMPSFADRACEYTDGACSTGHVLNDPRAVAVIQAFSREAEAARKPQNRPQRRKSRSKTRIGAKSSRASVVSTASGTG